MPQQGKTLSSLNCSLFIWWLVILFTSRENECSQDRNRAQEAFEHQARDTHHLKEHLMEEMGMDEEAATKYLEETSSDVHYFLMHDYDNNSKLDGLEIFQSFLHHDHSQHGGEENASASLENDVASFVDTILEDSDFNNDGYIDFPEFVTSIRQRRAQSEGGQQGNE